MARMHKKISKMQELNSAVVLFQWCGLNASDRASRRRRVQNTEPYSSREEERSPKPATSLYILYVDREHKERGLWGMRYSNSKDIAVVDQSNTG